MLRELAWKAWGFRMLFVWRWRLGYWAWDAWWSVMAHPASAGRKEGDRE